MGMIPVDRDDPLASIERLNRLKLDGFSVIIFPEGTRSPDGALLPFKKGAFVAAIHLGVPVVPVVCKGTTRIMPKGKYLSILPGEAEIVVLEPIPTTGMTYEDRDRLLEQVRGRIAEELAEGSGGGNGRASVRWLPRWRGRGRRTTPRPPQTRASSAPKSCARTISS